MVVLADFPLEVVENIIDSASAIEDDWTRRNVLYNCALTCHAWLHRSQYHLYRRVYLHNQRSLEHVSRFVRHLTSPLPPFQELHLSEEYLLPFPLPLSLRLRDAPFVHTVPLVLSQVAPSFTSLTITSIKWDRTPINPTFFVHISIFSSLSRLELNRCRFSTFGEFERLIRVLPSLSSLSIDTCTWAATGSGQGRNNVKRPRLDRLELCDIVDCAPLTEWLLCGPSRSSIRALIIDSRSNSLLPATYSSLAPLILSLRSVESLSLTLPVMLESSASMLRNFHNLRHLRVRSSFRSPSLIGGLATAISQADLVNVCKVDLEFPEDMNRPLAFFNDQSDWADLDRKLAVLHGAHLDSISVTYLCRGPATSIYHANHPTLSETREMMAVRLPLMRDRNMLVVRFGYISR